MDGEVDFRTLFETAPGKFLVLAPDFTIVAVTDSYLQATMTRREAILGRGLFEVFPDNPDDPEATGTSNLRASLNRVLANHTTDLMAIQKYDVRRAEKDGGAFEERYWSPINSPVFWQGEEKKIRYIIHRVEDVTDFVRLRQQGIQQSNEADELRKQASKSDSIRQAQRMEAMGQLAGGVAHDFNNLLAVMLIACESAEEHLAENRSAAALPNVQQVRTMAERAAKLTHQLLAFSRKQVLQPRPLNLNGVVESTEAMLRRLLGEELTLSTQLEPALWATLIDSGQVEQILLNLAVNARDAMPRGGEIRIETANVTLDKGLAGGTPKVEPGDYVMLAVKDSGIGMDAATQARLFEPFFTTKAVGEGTGLGLATVYGIVTQNRGTIWVYSELNKGTIFRIYLPRIAETAVQEGQTPVAPTTLAGHETILVAEDQEELRSFIGMILKEAGYKTVIASNGREALAEFKKNPSGYHLVVTDVVMPGMGGNQLFQELSSLNPQVRVLFLSGYTEDMLAKHGVSGSHPHFLEKPFSKKALLTKVRQAISEEG